MPDDLLIRHGNKTNDFLKLDPTRNLIGSYFGLNSRKGPTPQHFGATIRAAT
jgi:hypothetical protein